MYRITVSASRLTAYKPESGSCSETRQTPVSEDRLAARLEMVTERLATGALNLERPGADLIAYYLSQNRLPIDSQWSR